MKTPLYIVIFMILVITGNGKGKTTSAIGTAVRGLGWGKRVSMVFFDKGGSHYGERNVFDFLQPKMDVFAFGLERFDDPVIIQREEDIKFAGLGDKAQEFTVLDARPARARNGLNFFVGAAGEFGPGTPVRGVSRTRERVAPGVSTVSDATGWQGRPTFGVFRCRTGEIWRIQKCQ